MKEKKTVAVFLLMYMSCLSLSYAKVWKVGFSEPIKLLSQVTSQLNDGDTIYIMPGHYIDDKQVTFTKDHLYIKGIDKVILEAGPQIKNDQINGKGIFVTKGDHITIENITFTQAVVPDSNGAGIRQEGCDLKIYRCEFIQNEMGILCGSLPNCKTTIEYCTFIGNGSTANPGYQHNVYINHIDTFIFRFNKSIDATAEGHELKSRATFNYIAYNYIANQNSEDSRTIDLPNGGTTLLIGNVIEQGQNSANHNIIGFGLEGLTNPGPHQLMLYHNTLVNKKNGGSFIHIPSEGVERMNLINNIFSGFVSEYIIGNAPQTLTEGNFFENNIALVGYNDAIAYDYSLQSTSKAIDLGSTIAGTLAGYSLTPEYQFYSPFDIGLRKNIGKPDAGAYEYSTQTDTKNSETKNVTYGYPNPVVDLLYLNPNRDESIIMTDVLGKNITMIAKGVSSIDVSGLQSGIYFLKGESGKTQAIVKR